MAEGHQAPSDPDRLLLVATHRQAVRVLDHVFVRPAAAHVGPSPESGHAQVFGDDPSDVLALLGDVVGDEGIECVVQRQRARRRRPVIVIVVRRHLLRQAVEPHTQGWVVAVARPEYQLRAPQPDATVLLHRLGRVHEAQVAGGRAHAQEVGEVEARARLVRRRSGRRPERRRWGDDERQAASGVEDAGDGGLDRRRTLVEAEHDLRAIGEDRRRCRRDVAVLVGGVLEHLLRLQAETQEACVDVGGVDDVQGEARRATRGERRARFEQLGGDVDDDEVVGTHEREGRVPGHVTTVRDRSAGVVRQTSSSGPYSRRGRRVEVPTKRAETWSFRRDFSAKVGRHNRPSARHSRSVPSPLGDPGAPLVGRDRQARVLRDLVSSAREGRGGSAVVGGEAGIGKSRLVADVMRHAVADGMTVLEGRCIALGDEPMRHAALVDLLRDPRRPGGSAAERTGLADVTTERLLEELLAVVEQAHAGSPLLVVVEDLHWADRATCEVLMVLGRHVVSRPVGLVLTCRTDELPRGHHVRLLLAELEQAGVSVDVTLPRLDPADVATLIGVLGGTADDTAAARVYQLSAGNPLLVRELCAAWRADGGAAVPDELPLLRLLLVRVDRLSPPARAVADVVAVAGAAVDALTLDGVLAALGDGRPGAPCARHSTATSSCAAGDHVEFHHVLVADAVRAQLLPGERQHIHRAWAEALRATAPIGVLAHHWAEGGVSREALSASVSAGDLATADLAPVEATRHYRRALDLWSVVEDPARVAGCSFVELSRKAAESLHRNGDRREAVAVLDVARRSLSPVTRQRPAFWPNGPGGTCCASETPMLPTPPTPTPSPCSRSTRRRRCEAPSWPGACAPPSVATTPSRRSSWRPLRSPPSHRCPSATGGTPTTCWREPWSSPATTRRPTASS